MKTEVIQTRVDELLRKAIELFAENNRIATSSVVRMALANYEPLKAILEELKKEQEE